MALTRTTGGAHRGEYSFGLNPLLSTGKIVGIAFHFPKNQIKVKVSLRGALTKGVQPALFKAETTMRSKRPEGVHHC